MWSKLHNVTLASNFSYSLSRPYNTGGGNSTPNFFLLGKNGNYDFTDSNEAFLTFNPLTLKFVVKLEKNRSHVF